MENLTHSLVGATLAELALPVTATPAERRLFFAAGIVAANLPDADLLYSWIMPTPLGYLLQHRGYTHTVGGLVILAALTWLVLRLPRLRPTAALHGGRLWALIGIALASHVLLDSWNSYGVHPFWPVNEQWYYGDAISIFEPWLWIFLGLAVGANTRTPSWRRMLIALPMLLVFVTGVLRIIQPQPTIILLVLSGVIVLMGRRWTPRMRASAALVASATFVAMSFMLSHAAYASAANALTAESRAELRDIALTPRPAQPLCWSSLTVELHPATKEYVLRRGYVSLAPTALSWLGCGVAKGAGWTGGTRNIIPMLRDIVSQDCWARAWMQFARAPVLNDSIVYDARFAGASKPGGGFTELFVMKDTTRACPSHMTPWAMPRADLFQ